MNLQSLLKTTRKWFFNTPERALDEAYRTALMIKAIEDEHFQGQKVSAKFSENSESVVSYFEKEVNSYIQKIKARLIEFESSRSVVKFAQNVEQNNSLYQPDEALIIDKLNFIDNIINKYEQSLFNKNRSVALVPLASNEKNLQQNNKFTSNLDDISDLLDDQSSFKNKEETLETITDKTGVLPRSILRTFSRIRQEIDPQSPEAEEAVVNRYRKSRDKTAISIRFLLILVIVPLLIHQFAKISILQTHMIEQFFLKDNQAEFFINRDLEEEALNELKIYQEKLELKKYIDFTSDKNVEKTENLKEETTSKEDKIKEKAKSIVEEYKEKSINALANVFSDLISLFSFILILLKSKREIVVLKAFIDEIVYGLSDSAKAFLIILFTDIFVGYHSPHGWEVVLEGLASHLGIAESRQFNFLFIATFPVILDTVLKYWIFRYLNRISPSAVATYRNMNE